MQIAFSAALALFEGPAQILCVAALICTLAAGDLRGYRPGIVEAGLLLWALAGFVGHVGFEGNTSSADTTRPLMTLGLFVGLGLARASDQTLARCAIAFLGGLTLNAGYGLLQFTIGELPLDPYFIQNPKSGQIWIPGRVFHERASSGLFYNRLRLAHIGVAGVALAGLIVVERGAQRRARVAATVALGVIGAGVLFTYARMAFVALVVALVLVLAVTRVRPKIAALVAGAGGLTAVLFLLTEYGRRRIESLSVDMAVRRSMAEAAVQVIREHPVFGVGHGIYRTAVVPHMPEGLSGVTYTSPHNQLLQVMAETGAVGLVGFSAAYAGTVVLAARGVKRYAPRQDATGRLVRLAFLVLMMVFVIGLTHFALHHGSVGLLTWTAAGVAIAAGRERADG